MLDAVARVFEVVVIATRANVPVFSVGNVSVSVSSVRQLTGLSLRALFEPSVG
jgi:hypothetical protein